MGEFASKALAGTALGFGIGGTALNVLGGGLGNLLGGLGNTPAAQAAQAAQTAADTTTAATIAALLAASGRSGDGNCSEDHTVNRYEAEQNAKIAELQTEVKLRDANTYTDQKMLQLYGYVDGQLKEIRQSLCDQAVWNATQTSAISCIGQQVAALQSVFNNLTKVVIPNDSVCPGWGEATVTVSTGTSTT